MENLKKELEEIKERYINKTESLRGGTIKERRENLPKKDLIFNDYVKELEDALNNSNENIERDTLLDLFRKYVADLKEIIYF